MGGSQIVPRCASPLYRHYPWAPALIVRGLLLAPIHIDQEKTRVRQLQQSGKSGEQARAASPSSTRAAHLAPCLWNDPGCFVSFVGHFFPSEVTEGVLTGAIETSSRAKSGLTGTIESGGTTQQAL